MPARPRIQLLSVSQEGPDGKPHLQVARPLEVDEVGEAGHENGALGVRELRHPRKETPEPAGGKGVGGVWGGNAALRVRCAAWNNQFTCISGAE